MVDVVDLTKALIACPSVTPADEGAQALLATALETMGFTCWHLPFGEGDTRVENLFARLGTGRPHVCFAGHTDVVPPGDENAWTYPPFTPTETNDGQLYGRGASDMKGAVSAFIAGIDAFLNARAEAGFEGSISVLITGDEEGPAINGTVKVLEWMAEHGHTPDMALVGEPTNPDHHGQELKIGRRGSLGGVLTVTGKQGHVAYQHLADNPLPRLADMVTALSSYSFDEGSEFFLPTNLEVTTIDVGNQTGNVIPASGVVRFNIRFNDAWSGEALEAKVREILAAAGLRDGDTLSVSRNSESFLTQPSPWTERVKNVVADVTGRTPAYTTSGGTSDARFVVRHCPVVEYGAVNATIHQIDEHADVADIHTLADIYQTILERTF